MKPLTREWLEKAEADLGTARREAEGPNRDAVAFHSQQCAEKYLKAALCEHDIEFARIHDLVALTKLLTQPHDRLSRLREQLESLTSAAVESRYPGATTSAEEAASALQTAGMVRHACRELLSLPP